MSYKAVCLFHFCKTLTCLFPGPFTLCVRLIRSDLNSSPNGLSISREPCEARHKIESPSFAVIFSIGVPQRKLYIYNNLLSISVFHLTSHLGKIGGN